MSYLHLFVVTTGADVDELNTALDYLKTTGYPLALIEENTKINDTTVDFDKLVSLLLPSRHRFKDLRNALQRLIDMTAKPEQVELVLGLDLDDMDSLSQLGTLSPELDTSVLIQPHGQGYMGLYHLINRMAQVAHGHLLLFYSDDAVMQTLHWDLVLEPSRHRLCVLKADMQQDYNLFPIVSKALVEMMGHVSLHVCADTWIEDVAKLLDIEYVLPLQIVHDYALNKPHTRIPTNTYIKSYFDPDMCFKRHVDVTQIVSCIRADLALLSRNEMTKYSQNKQDLSDIYLHFYGFITRPAQRQWGYSRNAIVQMMNLLDVSDLNHFGISQERKSEVQYLMSQMNNLSYLLYTFLWNDTCLFKNNANVFIKDILVKIETSLQWMVTHLPNHLLARYYLSFVAILQQQDTQAISWLQEFIALCQNDHHLIAIPWWQWATPLGPLFVIHEWEELRYVTQVNTEAPYKRLLLWQAWHILGELRQKQQQFAQAQAAYQMANQVWPGHLLTDFRLCQIYFVQKQQVEFQSQWHAFLQKVPVDEPFTHLFCQQTPLTLYWAPLLAETLPWNESELALSLVLQQPGSEVADIGLTGERSIAPNHYQRVYDRITDFEQGYIGPNQLPFFFPLYTEQIQIEGLSDFNILIVVDDFLSDETEQLIQYSERIGQGNPAVTCVLWHPLQVPNKTQLEGLATRLEFMQTNFMVLQDAFLPDTQASVLQQCQVVAASPKAWLCYYLWWGIYLGVPLLLPNPLPFPYGGVAEVISVKSDVVVNYEAYKQSAMQTQQTLRHFYETQAMGQCRQLLYTLKQRKFGWRIDK